MVKEWGDSMLMKDDDCYRLVSKNIGSLGVRPNSLKEDQLKHWIRYHQIDVACLQEINVNWGKVKGKYRIHERFKKKDREEFKLSYAYNKNEVRNIFQRGGVCIHTCGSLLATTTTVGHDPRKLGRWSWFRFHGSDNVVVKVISAYFPCKNLDPRQTGSVYAQHRRFYLHKNVNSCPIENMKSEILAQIETWIQQGEKIILCADVNEDISRSAFVRDLLDLGIKSVMAHHSGETPPTQNRGTDTIDGIFISSSLRVHACGFSDFGDGPGDHRSVFVDIVKSDIEGCNMSSIQRISRRRLISTNIKVFTKFNNDFKAQSDRNHIIQRTRDLRNNTGLELSIPQMLEYEKIDRIVESAFHYANKRCRKFKSGDIAFAPDDVQKYSKRAKLWDLVFQKKTGCHINSSRIRRLAKDCDIDTPMQYTLIQVTKKRQKSRKKYYRVRPHSKELRRKWLQKKADEKEKEEGLPAAQYLHQLINKEDIRDSHLRIKFVRGKFGSGGTKKLTVPSRLDPAILDEVTDKDELEEILMQTNYDKFSAAKETPLAQSTLVQLIGATASTNTADAILERKYFDSTMCDAVTKEFLRASHIPPSIKHCSSVSAKITTEQHVQFWSKQNERTQSSKSGLHFGFFKSTAKDPVLAETLATLVSIPFETGYSPERWRQSVNVHLLKKPGEFSPSKQRTIHLIEASLSEGCKIIFSRRMMGRAKSLNLVPAEQFARKHCKASDAALLNVLIFDYMRLTRTCGISVANDLNSCYDRMVHTGTSLALRRMGAPKSAVQCMSKCIQYMRHYIRTAYGDSSTYYGGNANDPLQGGGQGNPAAPPMWIALTVVLIGLMNTMAPGVEIVTPISLLFVTLTVIMYVDDSTLFILGRQNEYPLAVIERAQTYVDAWCKYLWITGGALRPEKCWYTLVEFRWDDGFWHYADNSSVYPKLTASDAAQVHKPIKQLKSSDGARILGVRIAADGNNAMEKNYQLQSTLEWADNIQQGYLTRYDAVLAVKTTISKTWAYPLSATTFSFKDAVDIMTPAYKAALPKIGSNRHLPLVYRYGPVEMQGLGLPHIYTMQGISHISVLLSHLKRSNRISILLEAEMEYLALEIGNTKNIFTLDYSTWSNFCTKTWLTSTWKFCYEHNILISGPRIDIVRQREDDVLIMEKILDFRDHFTDKDLLLANQCRIFLRLMFLSDMCSGDGRSIDGCFIDGRTPIDRESVWLWPRQNNPSPYAWNQWRRALSIVWGISIDHRLGNTRLGNWIPNKHMNMVWHFSYNDQTKLVYRKVDNKWINYQCQELTRSRGIFVQNDTNTPPPPQSQRISVYDQIGATIYSSGVSGIEVQCNNYSLQSEDWWSQTVEKDTSMTQLILENTAFSCPQRQVRRYLQSNDIIVVCDGSYFPIENVAAASFTMESESHHLEIARGYCRVTGHGKELSPYRAELGGIHMVVNVLRLLCSIGLEKQSCIRIFCDCEAAIKMLRRYPESITLSTNHHDLLWDITSMLKIIPCKVKFLWVKGHQSTADIQSNQLARMNDSVDALAKAFARYCICKRREQELIRYGNQFWSLYYDKHRIVNKIAKTLTYHIHGKELISHLKKKYDLTNTEISCVDWESVGKAMTGLSLSERLWVTKHVSHFNGLGVKMAQCNCWESPKCPRCRRDDETHSHLISCSHYTCQDEISDGLLRFSDTLRTWNTDPKIHVLFMKKLRHPDKLMLDLIPFGSPILLIQAAKDQDLLGLDRFIEGRLVSAWKNVQQLYYDEYFPHTKRTGVRWAPLVIRNILRYCRSHWLVRNKYVEENKINREQETLQHRILDQLENEYAKGIDGIPVDERFLFNIELEQLKRLSIAAQRDWLDHVYTARHFYGERSTREQQRMQRFMERWLAPRGRRRTRNGP